MVVKLYSIRDWNLLFENNRSRKIEKLTWVAVPNKHDGENYAAIMQHKDGAIIFSAWILIVQVASKCQPRGTLVRQDGTPHTPDSLSLRTRAPKEWFEACLTFLDATDWLESVEYQPDVSRTSAERQLPNALVTKEGKEGREGKEEGKEGKEEGKERKSLGAGAPAPSFDPVQVWNDRAASEIPKILTMSSDRTRSLELRLKDQWWRENYIAGVEKINASDFCRGKNERGWVMTFDFVLRPGSLAKILEGKYDNRNGNHPTETPDYAKGF